MKKYNSLVKITTKNNNKFEKVFEKEYETTLSVIREALQRNEEGLYFEFDGTFIKIECIESIDVFPYSHLYEQEGE